jgi:2',3'-cyclic-nucleotide 2'-phosphodiesterase (5'-nucleotidase family)
MIKGTKKALSLILAVVMTFSLAGFNAFAVYAADGISTDLVIIHVNDAHGRDNVNVTTAGVAALKQYFEGQDIPVLLVSAGDAAQGTPLVNIDQGQSAIDFMNAAGYDLMVPGNHEFDWGWANLETILGEASFDVISANIYKGSAPLFLERKIYTLGGIKVGVFGLTTPETYTKTHPDKIAGLDFLAGQALYDEAQAQVDALIAAGADIVVCVGHLGVDGESVPNRSTHVIANVNGIDLFIDGHSHTAFENGDLVAWKNEVSDTLLVSTGEYLNSVGIVFYNQETQTFAAGLLNPGEVAELAGTDEDVKALVDARNAIVEEALTTVIGETEVVLDGERTTVRVKESNLGNFATDALLWIAKKELGQTYVDAAITNGGGIRASIGTTASAETPYAITMKDMATVFPYGNTVATVEITGAQLLEALEAATYESPGQLGAFPQVSGIAFEIHSYVEYAAGPQYGGSTYFSPQNPGSRVKNVTVNGQPLDLGKKYVIATNDFITAGGDTYAVFKQTSKLTNLGVAMEDAMIQYLTEEIGKGSFGTIATDSK